MLTLISPAKTLDFDTPAIIKKHSMPDFLEDSGRLIEIMRKKSPKKISQLMHISAALSELNADRFREWQFSPDNAKQAILAFRGDVYLGLRAETFNARDFTFAQNNLRILSGLYGLLKPLDLIQPYRLEMGIKLNNRRGKDLYSFWGNRIGEAIVDELEHHKNNTLINLASIEYFRSVNTALLPGPVITPVFKDFSNGSYKILGFFAKKARGYMASYIIKNRINKAEQLKAFNVDGYQFCDDFSTEFNWVFTRRAQ